MIDEIDDIPARKLNALFSVAVKFTTIYLEERRKQELNNVAIVRVEQLISIPTRRDGYNHAALPTR